MGLYEGELPGRGTQKGTLSPLGVLVARHRVALVPIGLLIGLLDIVQAGWGGVLTKRQTDWT